MIRRLLLISVLWLGASGVRAAGTVEQWGVFEVELPGPAGGNPFVEVGLAADFTDGERTFAVAGFYDGNGVYRVRFMPDRPGRWRYTTRSNRWQLTNKEGSFAVTPAAPGSHGPVRVAHTFHFAYADGTPFKQVGTTCYTWTHRPEDIQEQTLKTLAASPFNKLRMCVFPQDHGTKFMPPTRFPFEGTAPRRWDFTRFNPEFFRHLEQRIGQLRDLGVECDLILFHPYGKTWGFDTMPADVDDRYVRYVVARLAAYRNVWWSMANEYDFLLTKTEADWDRYFTIVRDADPYGHLRSIHNGNLVYNHTHPWVTHVSMQNGPAVEDPGRAELLRDVYRKPLVFDEVRYEGDFLRWANLSGREMVHRFWAGTVAGTYVGHSEFFYEPNHVVWLGQGGVLKGESPPRLAFLRRIMEESPAAGIDPIDRWERADIGGQPGEYYLVYFGHAQPTEWIFQLPRNRLADGMEFTVEVIDTWAMTVTPVEGVFVTKTRPAYKPGDRDDRVVDERDGRRVSLPGRPGMALRIRYHGGAAPIPAQNPPTEP
jgi:hypothetical protein